MINFQENHSLKAYNTFHIDARVRYFMEYTQEEDLLTFLTAFPQWKTLDRFVLGGGSNLLPVSNYEGLVIRPKLMGINQIAEDEHHVYLEVGAGEEWDNVVEFAVQHHLGGIENLSLIPGSVGAAAVQNIGAYGAEVCQVLQRVKGFHLQQLEKMELLASDCAYGYRDSIFKHELKEQFIIHSIVLRLDKEPKFNVGYGSLQEEIAAMGELNLRHIRQAIIKVRESKLPNPEHIGSAGSFFMNPVVNANKAKDLQQVYAGIPTYDAGNGNVKLAAGWLIDQCGWKGFRQGDAGVYEHQALVLVNYGQASGAEIAQLAKQIQQSVFEKFGVQIVPEVYYLGTK